MDDLLMAIKAAGASAAPATLVFSRPDEARFFCCVFPGIVHSCGGRTHEAFKRYRKLSRRMQAESAKKTAVKLMVDFPGYLF
jgi:hypothetical protein